MPTIQRVYKRDSALPQCYMNCTNQVRHVLWISVETLSQPLPLPLPPPLTNPSRHRYTAYRDIGDMIPYVKEILLLQSLRGVWSVLKPSTD